MTDLISISGAESCSPARFLITVITCHQAQEIRTFSHEYLTLFPPSAHQLAGISARSRYSHAIGARSGDRSEVTVFLYCQTSVDLKFVDKFFSHIFHNGHGGRSGLDGHDGHNDHCVHDRYGRHGDHVGHGSHAG
jgi:hypothetical protein